MKVTFIGGGIIGSGLAANAAISGLNTFVYTKFPEENESIDESIKKILNIFVENLVLTNEEAAAAYSCVTITNDLCEAVTDAELIQESVVEKLDIKKSMISEIEEFCRDDAVIASTTSTLSATSIQQDAKHPERIMIGHPFNPAYLLPLVEICMGDQTDMEYVNKAREIYTMMGKEPVVCKLDLPGFLVNRISRKVLDDARETVLSGACNAEDYDKALIYGPGMRMAVTGQLLTIDLGTQGGLRNNAIKYNRPYKPGELEVADSVDEEISNRPAEVGNNREDICKWRDHMIIEMLRLHGKY